LSTTRYAGGIEGSGDLGDYALSFTRFDTDNDVLNGSFNQETVAANVDGGPRRSWSCAASSAATTGVRAFPDHGDPSTRSGGILPPSEPDGRGRHDLFHYALLDAESIV